jgi:riboflavin synthase alpha subunit
MKTGEVEDEVIVRHMQEAECQPPVENRCRECKNKRLTLGNSIKCDSCCLKVCISHRHKHRCRDVVVDAN